MNLLKNKSEKIKPGLPLSLVRIFTQMATPGVNVSKIFKQITIDISYKDGLKTYRLICDPGIMPKRRASGSTTSSFPGSSSLSCWRSFREPPKSKPISGCRIPPPRESAPSRSAISTGGSSSRSSNCSTKSCWKKKKTAPAPG